MDHQINHRLKKDRPHQGLLIGALVVMFLVAPALSHAGPWVPEQWSGYAKTWFRWLPGFGFHDGQGETLDYASYHELGWNLYAEVGVLPSLAVITHLPLIQGFLLKDPHTGKLHSHVHPGDPSLGLRWMALQRGPFVLALETAVRAPLATDEPVQKVYSSEQTPREIGQLRVGAGVWDVQGGVSVGTSLPLGYLAASLMYVFRSGGYDHDLLWSVEGGLPFWERFSARARFTGKHPLPVGDEGVPRHSSPSGIGNGTSYVGFALEGDYRFYKQWFVGLSFEGGLLAVERQTGGPVLAFSLATKF